jgi:GNAT superfamily N-acetyltransferase
MIPNRSLIPGFACRWISNNAVLPAYQSAGIGTAMYSFVLNYMRETVMKSAVVTRRVPRRGGLRKLDPLALCLLLSTTSNSKTESIV